MTYPDPNACLYCDDQSCVPCKCGHSAHSHHAYGLIPGCASMLPDVTPCKCEGYEPETRA